MSTQVASDLLKRLKAYNQSTSRSKYLHFTKQVDIDPSLFTQKGSKQVQQHNTDDKSTTQQLLDVHRTFLSTLDYNDQVRKLITNTCTALDRYTKEAFAFFDSVQAPPDATEDLEIAAATTTKEIAASFPSNTIDDTMTLKQQTLSFATTAAKNKRKRPADEESSSGDGASDDDDDDDVNVDEDTDNTPDASSSEDDASSEETAVVEKVSAKAAASSATSKRRRTTTTATTSRQQMVQVRSAILAAHDSTCKMLRHYCKQNRTVEILLRGFEKRIRKLVSDVERHKQNLLGEAVKSMKGNPNFNTSMPLITHPFQMPNGGMAAITQSKRASDKRSKRRKKK